jgi:putative chitinase
MKLDTLESVLPKGVIVQLQSVIDKFAINTPTRLSHFLAQCSHESGEFKVVRENLNYSSTRLLVVFPKYFKTKEQSDAYARKPEKIANKVYGSRMGNGDEESGDGWKFSGKGYIQLTGKDNYSAFDKVVEDDILANPNLVATKYPLLSAGWFWNKNNLNTTADLGATDDVVIKISKKVNGGTIGVEDRITQFNKFYKSLIP